jgi:hypothetical protein
MYSRVKMPNTEMCQEYFKLVGSGGKPNTQDIARFRNNVFESVLLTSRDNQTSMVQWAIARYNYNCGANRPAIIAPNLIRGKLKFITEITTHGMCDSWAQGGDD